MIVVCVYKNIYHGHKYIDLLQLAQTFTIPNMARVNLFVITTAYVKKQRANVAAISAYVTVAGSVMPPLIIASANDTS